jgi:hypothetical protein
MPNVIIHFLATFFSACVALLIVVGLSSVTGIDIDQMTRDVTAIAAIHPFSGLLSNLGILLWSVSASICLFVAFAARSNISKRTYGFLLSSASISGWLLFDDLLLFHETLASWHLGLEEEWVMLCLVAVFAFYLLHFRKFILRTSYLFLIAAAGLFLSSVLVDVFFEDDLILGWVTFFEDALKWLGICFWCSYYIDTAYQILVAAYNISDVGNDIQVEVSTHAITDKNARGIMSGICHATQRCGTPSARASFLED